MPLVARIPSTPPVGPVALVVLVACIVASMASGCLAPKEFKGKKNRDFLVIGHRGAPNEEAENTIASMVAAATAGANAVEIDLLQTADGHIVLWHDLDPDDPVAEARRLGLEGLAYVPVVPPSGSDARRRVDQLTLEELRTTHGYARERGSPPDPDAPIATWDEIVDWLRSEPAMRALYLDVKVDQPDQARAIVRAAQDARAAGGPPSNVAMFLTSPHRSIVVAMKEERDALADEDLAVIWDFEDEGALAGAEELDLSHVSTGLTVTRSEGDFLDDVESLLEAREKNRIDSVTAWTIDRRMQLGILLYYGVDGIITNDPALLADLWARTL